MHGIRARPRHVPLDSFVVRRRTAERDSTVELSVVLAFHLRNVVSRVDGGDSVGVKNHAVVFPIRASGQELTVEARERLFDGLRDVLVLGLW